MKNSNFEEASLWINAILQNLSRGCDSGAYQEQSRIVFEGILKFHELKQYQRLTSLAFEILPFK